MPLTQKGKEALLRAILNPPQKRFNIWDFLAIFFKKYKSKGRKGLD